jgi:hypothetical protein
MWISGTRRRLNRAIELDGKTHAGWASMPATGGAMMWGGRGQMVPAQLDDEGVLRKGALRGERIELQA